MQGLRVPECKMQAAYSALLADPPSGGIWWYQSHDDGTGDFGFMDSSKPPAPVISTTLSSIAKSVAR